MLIPHDISPQQVFSALARALSPVRYPLVVLDVGAQNLRRGRRNAQQLRGAAVREVAWLKVDAPMDEATPEDISVIDLSVASGGDIEALVADLERAGCMVSHGIQTDVKLIEQALEMRERPLPTLASKAQFCTLTNGAYFSRSHIYRCGQKVKKWPNLQQLLLTLYDVELSKGDIIDDTYQCYLCFLWLEQFVTQVDHGPADTQ